MRLSLSLSLVVLSCLLCSCGTERRARPLHPIAGFSVLAEHASASDALPRQIAEALELSTTPEFNHADLAAARQVLPDNPVWLLPSMSGELCLAALDYPLVKQSGNHVLPPITSNECSTKSEALEGKLVVTRSLGTTARTAHGFARVYGVVPDGVEQIRVFFRHGHVASYAAIRNGYEAVVDDPERIEIKTRRAGHSITEIVPLTMPSITNDLPAR
ncbi:MAG TPA: hypothetical protein VKV16_00405 [Solirubrobacteraceae bacterium]|nr:hypothetical protein [Solirubrobacteraceae bacterium]